MQPFGLLCFFGWLTEMSKFKVIVEELCDGFAITVEDPTGACKRFHFDQEEPVADKMVEVFYQLNIEAEAEYVY